VLSNKISGFNDELINFTALHEEKEEAVKSFANDNPVMIVDCEIYAQEKLSKSSIEELSSTYETTLKNFRTRTESLKKEYAELVRNYEIEFHHFMNTDPGENKDADTLLKRLETSELPEYREKIAKVYQDAEKEFKEHFISRFGSAVKARDCSVDAQGIYSELKRGDASGTDPDLNMESS